MCMAHHYILEFFFFFDINVNYFDYRVLTNVHRKQEKRNNKLECLTKKLVNKKTTLV